jgi:hypothetical protein
VSQILTLAGGKFVFARALGSSWSDCDQSSAAISETHVAAFDQEPPLLDSMGDRGGAFSFVPDSRAYGDWLNHAPFHRLARSVLG